MDASGIQTGFVKIEEENLKRDAQLLDETLSHLKEGIVSREEAAELLEMFGDPARSTNEAIQEGVPPGNPLTEENKKKLTDLLANLEASKQALKKAVEQSGARRRRRTRKTRKSLKK
jgi:predicted HTH domain antitoxin